jgi:hypothetical protein
MISSTVVHWGSCTLTKLTFQVNVTGESPITEVSITLWNTDQSPNTLQLTKMGETVWSITIDANSDIPGSDMFMTSTLSYYFEAKNQAGLTAKSATYADITLTKCP